MADAQKNQKKKDVGPDLIKTIFDPDSVELNYPYTDTLKNFLLHKPVTNIALEGDFATGKSSVLYALLKEKEIKKKKPKLISSLTLDYGNQQNENKDKKTREDVSNTPTSISANNSSIVITGTKPEDNKDFVITLQSEIVRQLFYGEKANKIKNSPYGRMKRSYFAVPLAITFIIWLGWFISILKLAKDDNLIEYYFWNNCWLLIAISVLLIFIFGACIFVIVRKIITLISKSGIKHISLKDINFDLNDDKPDFKQLIDFIIEYFRITKRKIIIFEDLDRYNNPKIFEELNNLNQTINHSEYFKKDKKKVKFLYLTSGKIFNSASNKNKIFDAIIPMIPFMSASNAEYLFEQELKSRNIECAAAVEVIGSVSDLVTDMRVLKTIANRFALYWKVFELNNADDEDCKDCASLSVIAELCPKEFDKLTRNDSILDSIRIAGEIRRNEDISNIERSYSVFGLVSRKTEQIQQKIIDRFLLYGDTIRSFEVGEKQSATVSTNMVMDILSNMNLGMKIKYQESFGNKENEKNIGNSDVRQIIGEVVPLAIDRKRALKITEQEALKKRSENLLLLGLKREKSTKSLSLTIERLIESELIGESYVKYISKSGHIPKRDKLTDYLVNAIRRRDKRYGYSYPVNDFSEELLSKMRESDFLSVGILNFDIFDQLYRTQTVKSKIEKIIKLASIHKEEFITFYVAYLERGIQLAPMTSNVNYSAQMFEEFIKRDFELSVQIMEAMHLRDAPFSYSLMGMILANKEFNEDDVKICVSIPDFVTYIKMGMGILATDNAIRCHLSNGARIEKLDLYCQDSELLKNNIDKVSIFLNILNIHEMRTELLNKYLKSHAISFGEAHDVLKYGRIDACTVEIIVEKIDLLEGKKYDDFLKELYKKATHFDIRIMPDKACLIVSGLDEEAIEQYVVKDCRNRQETIEILAASSKAEFIKIKAQQQIMEIKNNKIGQRFAMKLEKLGLVQIINKKNEEYLKYEYIKLRVL